MVRFGIWFLSPFFLALLANSADAWNSVGHMVIAKLAYDQLDAKSQIELFRLLKSHPHYQEFLAASRPADIDNAVEWAVLRSSYWPDWIRPRKSDNRAGVSTFHRGEDHYITVPFIDPKDKDFFANRKITNPDSANIVSALKQRCNDLKTKTAANADRAVAICWIFHLIGDIHQPLHNASYFSREPAFINGDLGGNKFAIKADGRRWKLHAFWDDLLGADINYADDSEGHQAALYREALKVATALRGLKLKETDEERFAKNGTFESWSREGHDLARTIAYQKADGSGMLKPVAAPLAGAIPMEAEEVGKEYVQRARATAERQVVLAGRRLADRLKVLLRT